ncbi:MAG: glycosyltransferase [Bacilli bacterium]|nr:glycosyltransferase [Bacilli bacterium]
MKKITILALHLGYGGIEKCITSLANALIDDFQIEIVSTYKLYDDIPFKLNENIKIKYLIQDLKPNKKEFLLCLKKIQIINAIKEGINAIKILHLKKKLMIDYIKNCNSDIIISTRDIHNKWLGQYGKSEAVKIGWEHNHHNYNQKYIKKIINSVQNLDYFVLVSKSLKEYYEKIVKPVCIYIPNSLDEYPLQCSKLTEKNIISVGRLSKEKGFLDLIDVFKIVNDIYPDWCLNIIGDGSEKEKIENKIKENFLQDNIKLHGFQNKEYINKMYEKSSIYVMSSYSESFGIVLLEAFSYGIPAIAFDSAIGATEIISNNWDGYLINNRDKQKMAKKIIELITSPNRRIIMGNNASKKAYEYNIVKTKEEWLKILNKNY